jgi:uncharacterized membrane protein
MQNQKSAIGLDGNLASAIGYPIGILALILIFMEKDNKFVRFHALQSVLWGVLATVVLVPLFIIGMIFFIILAATLGTIGSIIGGLVMMVAGLISLAVFALAIYAAIKAYGGEEYKLPIVGNMVQKWV